MTLSSSWSQLQHTAAAAYKSDDLLLNFYRDASWYPPGVSFDSNDQRSRMQQGFELPDYTSPPLPNALEATPEPFRSDDVIDAMRAADSAGNCANENYQCQIPFVHDASMFDDSSSSKSSALGVILYGGALVDPRSYAVLAHRLAHNYGLPVVIPVFANDLAPLAVCSTGRVELASTATDIGVVDSWLLVGHSLGGVAASKDAWVATQNATTFDQVAGLVLLASDVQSDQSCDGDMDFSATGDDFPVAAITATNDLVLNMTRWQENTQNLPESNTLFVSIEGGNHGQFGSYNDSERIAVLGPGQVDGIPTIPAEEQWDLTAQAIYEIAVRTGLDLPRQIDNSTTNAPDNDYSPTVVPTAPSGAATPATAPWMLTTLMLYATTFIWSSRGWTR